MLTSKILNARPRSLIGDLSPQLPDPSATMPTQYCMVQIPASPSPPSGLENSDLRLPIAYRKAQSTAPRSHIVARIYQSIHRRAPLADPGLTITIPTRRHPDAGSRLPHARSQLPVRNSWAQHPRYEASYFRIPAPRSPIRLPEALFPDTGSLARAPRSPIPVRKSQDAMYPPDRSAQSTDPRFKLPESRYQKTDAGHQLAGT